MYGQVIEGRYAGCPVYQLSEKNILFIQPPQGDRVLIVSNTAESMTDITPPGGYPGQKRYLVRWKDGATSLLQVQQYPQSQEDFPRTAPVTGDTVYQARTPEKKKRKAPIIIALLLVLLLIGGGVAAWQLGLFHQHSWRSATCDAPKTCRDCGETEGEALGHEPGQWEVDSEAGFSRFGTEVILCQECDELLEEREYILPAFEDGICNADLEKYGDRLQLYIDREDLGYTISSINEDDELLCLLLRGDEYDTPAFVGFVNREGEALVGPREGDLGATCIYFAFQTGYTGQIDDILPIALACNNTMDLEDAEALAEDILAAGTYEQDGVQYLFGTAENLDFFFMGYEGVPASIDELPAMEGSDDYDTNVDRSSLVFNSNGTLRDAASFANAFGGELEYLYQEWGYMTLECEYMPDFDYYAYSIREEGFSHYSILAFAYNDELLVRNGPFNSIYLMTPMENDDQVTAFALQSAFLVNQVDPDMGELSDCVTFLQDMTAEYDGSAVVKERHGFEYYLDISDDGDFVTLIITF